MAYERAQIDTIEKLEMVIGAAQRKYVTVKEGAALYGMGIHGFDKLAKDAGAKRKIGTKVLINTQKLDDYHRDNVFRLKNNLRIWEKSCIRLFVLTPIKTLCNNK